MAILSYFTRIPDNHFEKVRSLKIPPHGHGNDKITLKHTTFHDMYLEKIKKI